MEGRVKIVISTGDRHEFAAIRFPPSALLDTSEKEDGSKYVYEFSTSPLSMFYLPVHTYWENKDGGGKEWEDSGAMSWSSNIPDGNSKVAAVEIEDVEGTEQWILRFTLYVDGKEAWKCEITAA